MLINKADSIAKQHRHLISSLQTDLTWEPALPLEIWSVSIDSTKICSQLAQLIYNHTSAVSIRDYWHQGRRPDERVFQDVEWQAVSMAMRSIPPS
jgi:hypothetical protein